jgi:hypothetical protein
MAEASDVLAPRLGRGGLAGDDHAVLGAWREGA